MSKIVVAHATFEMLGGAERLALETGTALQELGYTVDIVTAEAENLEQLTKFYGKPLSIPIKIVEDSKPILSGMLRRLRIGEGQRLRRLEHAEAILKWLNSHDYDLAIETQLNIPTPVDISYIHYPATREYIKTEGLARRIYNKLVEYKARSLGKSMAKPPRLILTNSRWTAMVIQREYGLKAHVLYPAVHVEEFIDLASNDQREKLIVTISRITYEKNLELLPRILDYLGDYTLVLVGTTSRYSKRTLAKLERARKKYPDRFLVETNVPRSKILEYLARARYYLHPPFPEHFGISVVEAMASGLIPLVLRDGGVWTDVVGPVSDRLGYHSLSEVAGIIRILDKNPKRREELRERVISRAREFSYERFKEKLGAYITNVMNEERR